jgi:hypothetical protein
MRGPLQPAAPARPDVSSPGQITASPTRYFFLVGLECISILTALKIAPGKLSLAGDARTGLSGYKLTSSARRKTYILRPALM